MVKSHLIEPQIVFARQTTNNANTDTQIPETMVNTNINETNGTVQLTCQIDEQDDISDVATAVWEMLEQTYRTHPNAYIDLRFTITGHRNDEGGYSGEIFRFMKHVCMTLIAPFVDRLEFGDYGAWDTSDETIAGALAADREKVEEEEGEIEIIPEGATSLTPEKVEEIEPIELLAMTNLSVGWDDAHDDLYWGLEPAS